MVSSQAHALRVGLDRGWTELKQSLRSPQDQMFYLVTAMGMLGYVTGQIFYQSANLIPSIASILIPGFFLFDNLMHRGLAGWLTMVWVVVLGLVATLPIGIIVGSVVPGVQKVGTYGMLPIMLLAGISGIFTSMDGLWDWLKVVAHRMAQRQSDSAVEEAKEKAGQWLR